MWSLGYQVLWFQSSSVKMGEPRFLSGEKNWGLSGDWSGIVLLIRAMR